MMHPTEMRKADRRKLKHGVLLRKLLGIEGLRYADALDVLRIVKRMLHTQPSRDFLKKAHRNVRT